MWRTCYAQRLGDDSGAVRTRVGRCALPRECLIECVEEGQKAGKVFLGGLDGLCLMARDGTPLRPHAQVQVEAGAYFRGTFHPLPA